MASRAFNDDDLLDDVGGGLGFGAMKRPAPQLSLAPKKAKAIASSGSHCLNTPLSAAKAPRQQGAGGTVSQEALAGSLMGAPKRLTDAAKAVNALVANIGDDKEAKTMKPNVVTAVLNKLSAAMSKAKVAVTKHELSTWEV